jgi:hypothetical protein
VSITNRESIVNPGAPKTRTATAMTTERTFERPLT